MTVHVSPQCGIASHKRCLETLTYECGSNKAPPPPRRMTTFGVDFCSHVSMTQHSVPLVVAKCTKQIDEHFLDVKVRFHEWLNRK